MDLASQVKQLLFIDIETASAVPSFGDLPERMQALWARKGKKLQPEATDADSYAQWAALFAEFGRVITIGLGYFHKAEDEEMRFRVKAIQHENEAELLEMFAKIIDGRTKIRLVAHNGIEFDYPYIGRRFLINGLPLPKTLDLMAKKPWEIKHLDTLQLWRFGEMRNFTSLELLCEILGVPSSKNDLDGSKVSAAFHQDNDLARIGQYCMNDVVATARVYLRMNGLPNLPDENIDWV